MLMIHAIIETKTNHSSVVIAKILGLLNFVGSKVQGLFGSSIFGKNK